MIQRTSLKNPPTATSALPPYFCLYEAPGYILRFSQQPLVYTIDYADIPCLLPVVAAKFHQSPQSFLTSCSVFGRTAYKATCDHCVWELSIKVSRFAILITMKHLGDCCFLKSWSPKKTVLGSCKLSWKTSEMTIFLFPIRS